MKDRFKPAHYVFKQAEDGDGWNELTLICQGIRIMSILNGVVMTDWDGHGVLNNAAHVKHRAGGFGHFALQLHTDDELRMRFNDIRARKI